MKQKNKYLIYLILTILLCLFFYLSFKFLKYTSITNAVNDWNPIEFNEIQFDNYYLMYGVYPNNINDFYDYASNFGNNSSIVNYFRKIDSHLMTRNDSIIIYSEGFNFNDDKCNILFEYENYTFYKTLCLKGDLLIIKAPKKSRFDLIKHPSFYSSKINITGQNDSLQSLIINLLNEEMRWYNQARIPKELKSTMTINRGKCMLIGNYIKGKYKLSIEIENKEIQEEDLDKSILSIENKIPHEYLRSKEVAFFYIPFQLITHISHK